MNGIRAFLGGRIEIPTVDYGAHVDGSRFVRSVVEIDDERVRTQVVERSGVLSPTIRANSFGNASEMFTTVVYIVAYRE